MVMAHLPSFQLHFSDPILKGLACIAKLDGKHPSLVCGTDGGRIFVHTPHQQNQTGDGKTSSSGRMNDVQYLNINRPFLFIGTQATLLAYDVEANADVFYKDVPDGVSALAFGSMTGSNGVPLVFVGGNCSIQGFDVDGAEVFWTVAGDNVTAMTLCDINMDGVEELIVGSADYEIRIFQNEEVLSEITEADCVTGLCHTSGNWFAYALQNGTVGVYEKVNRVWRVKSRHFVNSICAFDIDGDGFPEVITGWSNGKLEARSARTGDVVFRDHLPSPITALLVSDYRMSGSEELICCCQDGQVRGYLPLVKQESSISKANIAAVGVPGPEDVAQQEQTLADLSRLKQELMYELLTYENRLRPSAASFSEGSIWTQANTRMTCTLERNIKLRCCELLLNTNNDAVIRGVIVIGEHVCEGGSFFFCPSVPVSALSVPVSPVKDVQMTLNIKALIGAKTSPLYHVYELECLLPKFSMYTPLSDQQRLEMDVMDPISSLRFPVNERIPRVMLWLNENFQVDLQPRPNTDTFDLYFLSLRDMRPLIISLSTEDGGQMIIRTDNMELSGDFVQDLCSNLMITELESIADFPSEMDEFCRVLEEVENYNTTRQQMTMDMADACNQVKALLIRAEDARMLGDMKLMKRMYSELYSANNGLILEHTKRATNHAALLSALKQVNQMIQKAARLRVGMAKTKTVAACRNALKENNIHSLLTILKFGDAAT